MMEGTGSAALHRAPPALVSQLPMALLFVATEFRPPTMIVVAAGTLDGNRFLRRKGARFRNDWLRDFGWILVAQPVLVDLLFESLG
jgi:hypothetical protein